MERYSKNVSQNKIQNKGAGGNGSNGFDLQCIRFQALVPRLKKVI